MTAALIRSRRWKVAAILAGFVAVIFIAGLSHRDDEVDVWVTTANYQNIDRLVTTNGTVLPTNEFQARAFSPGIIQKVYVELGDKVRPGQMLVSMKDPFAVSRMATANAAVQGARVGDENIRNGGSQEDLIALKGDLAQAKIAQSNAAKSLAALQQLQTRGAASTAEVDAAEQKLQTANTTLATLKEKSTERYRPSNMREADARVADAQATLDAAKNQFNNANISSPMAGTVYSVKVVNYDFVPVGADLIRVANLNNVEVRAYFDEPEIGKLAAGQPVKIVWNGKPDRTWHGHIKQAPIAATALGTRSVGECVIAVDDAKEDLLPNTNVTVTATIQQHADALTIPRGTLHADGSANYVYRIVDGRLHWTPVDVGIVNLDRAEITRGITDNDVIVLNAVDDRALRDGTAVRPTHSAPSNPGSVGPWLKHIISLRTR